MASLIRERVKFSLLNGSEEADVSWHWFSASGSGADLTAGINATFTTAWDLLRPTFPDSTVVAGHKTDLIDITTGKVLATNDALLPISPNGSNTSGSIPTQCAVVVSMRTLGVGPSARGRFYMPAVGNNKLTTSGTLASVPQQAIANAMAGYFDDVQAAEAAWHVGVYSRVHHSFTPATSVDVGSVIDTQRRRRSALVEARYSVPLAS